MMTIKYSLTRSEIVRSFLLALRTVPRLRSVIIGYSLLLGVFSLLSHRVFSGSLALHDVFVALAWSFFALILMQLWLFVRGKTTERTLTISEQGIATEIGSMHGQIPWSNVKAVTSTRSYIVIVGLRGNSFIIPDRAFGGSDARTQFVAQIQQWRGIA